MASKNVAFKACFRGWVVWNILKDFRSNLWGKFSSEKECQWYPLPLGCTNLTARTLWSWYRDVKYLSNYLLNKSPNICFSMNCPDEYCSMKIVRMNIVWMNIIGMNIVRMNMVRWILSGWILSGEYCPVNIVRMNIVRCMKAAAGPGLLWSSIWLHYLLHYW